MRYCYHPSTQLWESNVFTHVCLSTGGGGVSVWCYVLSGCLVPCSFQGSICPWGSLWRGGGSVKLSLCERGVPLKEESERALCERGWTDARVHILLECVLVCLCWSGRHLVDIEMHLIAICWDYIDPKFHSALTILLFVFTGEGGGGIKLRLFSKYSFPIWSSNYSLLLTHWISLFVYLETQRNVTLITTPETHYIPLHLF